MGLARRQLVRWGVHDGDAFLYPGTASNATRWLNRRPCIVATRVPLRVRGAIETMWAPVGSDWWFRCIEIQLGFRSVRLFGRCCSRNVNYCSVVVAQTEL